MAKEIVISLLVGSWSLFFVLRMRRLIRLIGKTAAHAHRPAARRFHSDVCG